MSVTNGNLANAVTFNNAFVSKSQDSTMEGVLALSNAGSGADVTNVQSDINTAKTDITTLESDVLGLQTDLTEAESDIVNLQTLTGVADESSDLGTFTGTTIADSTNIKAALQSLETAVETASGNAITALQDTSDLETLTGVADGSTNLGTFTGSTISDSATIKTALQELETEVETKVDSVNGETGAVSLEIDDLSDVTITSIAAREFLRRNAGNTAYENFNNDSSADDATSGSNVTLATIATSVVRLTSATLVSIDMIPAGFSGQKFIIINRTTVDVDINNETGATATNRIYTGTGAQIALSNNAALLFSYDNTTQRWQVVGGSGGGTGASAANISVKWEEASGIVPSKEFVSFHPVYNFGAGLAQELYAIINVPSTYLAGNPIKLYVKIVSAAVTNNILIRAQSTLIRKEVDEYTSTTNQRTTTNSAITMSAANSNEPQLVTLDISSSIGQVNVAVNAHDHLLVRIYRDTDTATEDVYLFIGSEEVTIE